MEGEPQAGGVPLGEAPLAKDEIVLPDQGQGVVERPMGGRGKHDVVEGPARDDPLDQFPGGSPEEEIAYRIGHP